MVIKARWVHTIPTPSSTTAPLSSTSTQSCPFHCINIQLHKHSVRLTLRPGPEAVGGTHFLITDASSILTHHRSGENSWSLSLLGCRVFSSITQLLHQAPKCTASGCAQPCVDHKCAESTKYAYTHTCTRIDRGDALVRALMRFIFFFWLHDAHSCFWGRLPVRMAYEIKDVNVNTINCNYDVSAIPVSQTVVIVRMYLHTVTFCFYSTFCQMLSLLCSHLSHSFEILKTKTSRSIK